MKRIILLTLALSACSLSSYAQKMVVYGKTYLHNDVDASLRVDGALSVESNQSTESSLTNNSTIYVKGDLEVKDAKGISKAGGGNARLIVVSPSPSQVSHINGLINQDFLEVPASSDVELSKSSVLNLSGAVQVGNTAAFTGKGETMVKDITGSVRPFVPGDTNVEVIERKGARVNVGSMEVSPNNTDVHFEDGAFVHLQSTSAANVSVGHNITPDRDYYQNDRFLASHFGSPVSTDAATWANFDQGSGSSDAVYSYNGTYTGSERNTNEYANNISVSKGYLVKFGTSGNATHSLVPSGGEFKLTGTLQRSVNHTAQLPSIPSGDFVFVSNPYLEYMLMEPLKTAFSDGTGAVYVSDDDGAYYIYDIMDNTAWQGSSAKAATKEFSSGVIPPFKAFWMASAMGNVNNNELKFGQGYFSYQVNNTPAELAPEQNIIIRMQSDVAGEKPSTLVISTRPYEVSNGLDIYDIPNLGYDDSRAFMTFNLRSEDGNSGNYIFQNKVTSDAFLGRDSELWYPLTFENIQGKKLDFEFQFPDTPEYHAIIEDLRSGKRYVVGGPEKGTGFSFEEGDGKYRLFVGARDIVPPVTPIEDLFAAHAEGDNVKIIVPAEYAEKCQISLVDMLGRVLTTEGTWDGVTYTIPSVVSNSVYLVLIVTQEGQKITKKLRQ